MSTFSSGPPVVGARMSPAPGRARQGCGVRSRCGPRRARVRPRNSVLFKLSPRSRLRSRLHPRRSRSNLLHEPEPPRRHKLSAHINYIASRTLTLRLRRGRSSGPGPSRFAHLYVPRSFYAILVFFLCQPFLSALYLWVGERVPTLIIHTHRHTAKHYP